MKNSLWALALCGCSVDVSYLAGPQSYSCGANEKCPGGKVCVQGLCCAAACERAAETTCGFSGECKSDGTGCALYDSSITCAAASCNDGQVTLISTCNGEGVCQPQSPTPCPGNFTCADALSCKTSCAAKSDCNSGYFCSAGACALLTANGDACEEGSQCASSICVQGVCCVSSCTDQGASSCGTTGACETTGANKGNCQFYDAGTSCSAQKCNDGAGGGQYVASQVCIGDGSPCPTPAPVACSGAASCSGTNCAGACTPGTQIGCTTTSWCRTDTGSGLPTCVAGEQQPGDSCNHNTDCTGGGHCDLTTSLCCTGSGQCCNDAATDCPASTVCNPSGCGDGTTWSCSNHVCSSSTASCAGIKRTDCTAPLTAHCAIEFGPPDCGAHLAPPCPEACPTPCQYAEATTGPNYCNTLGCMSDSDCESGYFCLEETDADCYDPNFVWYHTCLPQRASGLGPGVNCCNGPGDECLSGYCGDVITVADRVYCTGNEEYCCYDP